MALWKRNNGVWYYGFRFAGREYQGCSSSTSKTIAREAMLARRRELETGINGIVRQERVLPFKVAAKQWLECKVAIARNTRLLYGFALKPLTVHFGGRLLCDINARDIARYQNKRLDQNVTARTVNLEVQVLRQVLKAYKLWRNIEDDVKLLPERSEVGKALSYADEERIMEACGQSRAPALLTMFVLAIDSGLRADELRHLRQQDMKLIWTSGVIESGWLTVSKSKTDAGRGRTVPLTRRACACLTMWLATCHTRARFPDAQPDHYIFPAYKVGVSGDIRAAHAYGVKPKSPIGDWGKAWEGALHRANAKLKEEFGESTTELKFRWHDLRHSFITRILENPNVSEQTCMALAGHVSKAMLARYSHIRAAAKVAAVMTLERGVSRTGYLQVVPAEETDRIESRPPTNTTHLN